MASNYSSFHPLIGILFISTPVRLWEGVWLLSQFPSLNRDSLHFYSMVREREPSAVQGKFPSLNRDSLHFYGELTGVTPDDHHPQISIP